MSTDVEPKSGAGKSFQVKCAGIALRIYPKSWGI